MSESTLACPKCHGAMRSYERSGVVIDQCSECRGIFLDRGELERLLDLAAGTVAPSPAQQQQPNPTWSGPDPDRSWRQQQPQAAAWPAQKSRHDWDDDSDSHRGRGHGSYGRKAHKRRSLLGELFDF